MFAVEIYAAVRRLYSSMEEPAACKPVIIALDNGPSHTSKATRAALEARKHWLKACGLSEKSRISGQVEIILDMSVSKFPDIQSQQSNLLYRWSAFP
jgi:hypothetical protein